MSKRYFISTPVTSERPTLDGPEAHHLLHVMRARRGEEIVLFDGSGTEFLARVEKVGRAEVELVIYDREPVDRELPVEITLGVALPKGDRQKWLVEKAVELGVARVVPLETARSVAQPGGSAIERLKRSVIEASKQCGRNRLMEIDAPRAWEAFVGDTPPGTARLLAQPGGDPVTECLAGGDFSGRNQAILAIGPEGGWTGAEIELARAAHWQSIDLGPRILRIETAATLLVAFTLLATR